ncbi:MAG: hypothetical protein HYS12_17715 [Planctomycetes bacterium]|nr:hypothetical protein [Planctomycetota bacterium]
MASPAQQQAFQRKLIYLGAVVVLLLSSLLWRRHVVEARAEDLALLEQNRGDVEVVGTAIRLGLSGSRGLVICGLWMTAIDKQKKNQWNELELYVRTLTKLQPHFITPWKFQSWNLAYNVSVESDRPSDKYFYISRGIQLLAEGERQNRYNPELRRDMGFFHQHKICQSDETNILRSIFQLSCIPPVDREPERFGYVEGKPDWEREIKWDEFAKFCVDHPHLVRRLHTPPLPYDPRREHYKFRCKDAREVIAFLAEHRNLPSLYVDKEEDLKNYEQRNFKPNELERFPLLPPVRSNMFDPDEWAQDPVGLLFHGERRPSVDPAFDPYTVARAWSSYAQEALPPPGDLPGSNAPIKDRLRERVPTNMRSIIFRSAPALAQTHIAERLQEEGWYDGEPFVLQDWFKNKDGYKGEPVKVGGKLEGWSQLAWAKAYKAWYDFGTANHIRVDPLEMHRLEAVAEKFQKDFHVREGEIPDNLDPEALNEEQKQGLFAVRFLQTYDSARHDCNFDDHLVRTNMERDAKTVLARKLFYEAEQARLARQARLEALEKYEQPEALQAWREILEQNKGFRDLPTIQEETFETELKYLRAYRFVHGANLTSDLALGAFLGQAAAPAPLAADWTLLGLYSRHQLLPEPTLLGPFDGNDSQGQPLIYAEVKQQVKGRRGLLKHPPTDKPPQMAPPSPRPPQ